MSAGSTEAPDTGRPAASTFHVEAAIVASAAYGSIQRPAWNRYLAARAEAVDDGP